MHTITDRSVDGVPHYTLDVGDAKNVVEVYVGEDHQIRFNINIAGPMRWPEINKILAGMVDMAVTADELAWRIENGTQGKALKRAGGTRDDGGSLRGPPTARGSTARSYNRRSGARG